MPNIRAATKRVRADQKRRQRNVRFKSELKSLSRKFQKLSTKDAATSSDLYRTYVKRLDQAASKGLIHRKTASRKKSRLARAFAKLTVSSS